jgi:hypothetical protein
LRSCATACQNGTANKSAPLTDLERTFAFLNYH